MAKRDRKKKERRKRRRKDRAARAGRPGRPPAPAPVSPPAAAGRSPAGEPGTPPVRRRVTWQVAVRLLPRVELGTEEGPFGEARYAWGLGVAAGGTGWRAWRPLGASAAPPGPEAVRGVLEALAEERGAWPGAIEVEDEELAAALGAGLGERGVEVTCRSGLRFLDEAYDELLLAATREAQDDEVTYQGEVGFALVRAPRVTPGLLRSWHEAWQALVEAPIGRLLLDADVLRLEAPAPPRGVGSWLRRASATGPAPLSLVLFPGRRDAMEWSPADGLPGSRWGGERWLMAPASPLLAPLEDQAVFARLGLRPIGPWRQWPIAVTRSGRGGRLRPADGPRLAWMILVVRGLASTRPADVATGAWEVTVEGPDGPVTCRFSIEGDTAEDGPGTGAEELYRELGRLAAPARWTRARQVLERDPRHPVALLFLAPFEEDPGRRREMYRAAFDEARSRWDRAGDRAADEERIGPFLAEPLDPARSYRRMPEAGILRACSLALATELELAGRPAEAAEVLAAVARVPDLLGVRRQLLRLAILGDRLDLVDAALEAWGLPAPPERQGLLWLLGEALYRWRIGEKDVAAAFMERAWEESWAVGRALLVHPDVIPEEDEPEAHAAVADLFDPWRRVPGALAWLYRLVGPPSREREAADGR